MPGLSDEQQIRQLANLELLARQVVEGFITGLHQSPFHGFSVEFAEHRLYNNGESVRNIDWKLFAKSNQYLVRESATESNQQLRFVLDLSGSMNYTERGVSRLYFAKILLASLAYLANRQSDEISLYSLHEGSVQTLVPPGKQAFQKIVALLESAQASGPWASKATSFPEFSRKQSEMLVIASDFLQVDDEWVNFIQKIAGPRREIVIFQLLGDQEMDFSMSGFYRFQDLETGKELEIQAVPDILRLLA